MSKEFPHPCCQCGFCCMVEICPKGKECGAYSIFMGEEDFNICNCLIFDMVENKFTCALVEELGEKDLGIGEGCCIKARAYKDGKEFDFASLPPEMKRGAAIGTLLQRIGGRIS